MKCSKNYKECNCYQENMPKESQCVKDSNIGFCINKPYQPRPLKELWEEAKEGLISSLKFEFGKGMSWWRWWYNRFNLLNGLAQYSMRAYSFGKGKNWKKGWYTELQKEWFWKYAKRLIIRIITEDYTEMMPCYFCNLNFKNRRNLVIHHIKYDKKEIFNPDYIKLAHFKCHDNYNKELKEMGVKLK